MSSVDLKSEAVLEIMVPKVETILFVRPKSPDPKFVSRLRSVIHTE